MLYIVASWTGFRKGEIGSLTLRSFRLDDDPPTATVAASYSKRRRADSQVLHPELVKQLREWIATKRVKGDRPLFPISGRVPGGTERKTNKMMELDLRTARQTWLEESEDSDECLNRIKADFLRYCNHDGLFADFHSMRHGFITAMGRAGITPKTAQVLARHSDVRLTLGVYTHVEILASQCLPLLQLCRRLKATVDRLHRGNQRKRPPYFFLSGTPGTVNSGCLRGRYARRLFFSFSRRFSSLRSAQTSKQHPPGAGRERTQPRRIQLCTL